MVAFIIGFCASSMQVAHLFATTDTKNVASQMVLKKNGFQKVAGIDIQSHDGNARTSFLFERAGEWESDPAISAGTDCGSAARPAHQWFFGSTSASRSR